MWTTPEHVRNWWGFERDPMTVCEIDLRVGGQWRYVSVNEEHGEIEFYGEYLEIDPPHRLVSTEVYAPYPESPAVTTLTLEERDGATTMSILVRYQSREARDATIATGMETGLQVSLDRVDAILSSLQDGA